MAHPAMCPGRGRATGLLASSAPARAPHSRVARHIAAVRAWHAVGVVTPVVPAARDCEVSGRDKPRLIAAVIPSVYSSGIAISGAEVCISTFKTI